MKNIRFHSILFLLFITCTVQAQQFTASLKGFVKTQTQQSIARSTIRVGKINLSTDENGYYEIKNIKERSITISVSAVGFQNLSKTIVLKTGENSLNLELTSDQKEIDQVEVFGRTKAQEVNRQAFNVTAVDATKLYNTTMDISSALDRVAGVRVRESGGVGSNFNLMLNGFNGDQIRYFIDGIPMENFGSAFQINNIPINIAERIEIYKGVVPVWLGSDALGGAVNIVTGDRMNSYVDASYSFGSFNTHRTVINAAHTTKKGLYFQLNAFQNYSDNNYKVTVDVADINTGVYKEGVKLKRFHDTYHNESLIANIGVVNKPYADKLLFGIVLGQSYKEIQTGARMVSVFGGWHNRGTTVMPTFKYKKNDFLTKGLDVIVNGNINLGSNQNIDTVHARFDWYGNRKNLDGPGGERSYSMYKYKNNAGVANAIINYKLSERQSLSLTDVFNTFKRSGQDEVNPQNAANERAQLSQKNVLSFGYQYDIKDRFSLNAFLKHYNQHNASGNNELEKNISKLGYGTALSYYLAPTLQIKGSYELTTKMPTPTELFGDVENYEGNASLKPEKSNNMNLGLLYDFHLNPDNRFALIANAFYRHADNFIYQRLNNNQSKYVSDNRDGVQSIGGDLDLRYSHKRWFMAGLNATYQSVKNMQKVEPGYTGISPLYKNQMPNIPYLFGNLDASVIFPELGGKNNRLNVGANLLYVHEFWLYWPGLGSTDADAEKRKIPTQLSLDANIVYSIANGRYNIALEGKNLTDNRLVDNFSLQKPSRGFYLNLRYFFNKQNNL
jgi:outer membrane receptor protein involved in Fe transport